MFGYYLDLALRSFRRNVALTALMVLAIAFGVGASVTTIAVFHVLSGDPIPGKSSRLHYVQLDPRPMDGYRPGKEPPRQLTRRDAEALWRAHRADKQALMTGGSAAIDPDREGLSPFFIDGRWTSADFFTMFDVPFVAGGPWTDADDEGAARVAVIGRDLATKLYGTTDAVGKSVRVKDAELRVVGVIDRWRPTPHFYDLNSTAFGQAEAIYVPWSTSRALDLERNGEMNCWDETQDPAAVGAPCEWVQFWVELDSAPKLAAYRDFLTTYSEDEKAAGRFQRPPNIRTRDVMAWLAYRKVVPDDVTLQIWIALGFLVVCLLNTVGLLLTKFMRRSAEIGVRRALGASRRAIFVQLLVEAASVGLAGGVLGLGLAWLGLWAVRHQPAPYADLARLDLPMLALTFGLAVFASLLAGILPAWRGCQVTPAIQLKSL